MSLGGRRGRWPARWLPQERIASQLRQTGRPSPHCLVAPVAPNSSLHTGFHCRETARDAQQTAARQLGAALSRPRPPLRTSPAPMTAEASYPLEHDGQAARRSPGKPPLAPPPAAARRNLARHSGPLDPRVVPCSVLGIKEIHAARTMGPPSGAELVSPSKWLRPHEKEPRLPQRASPGAGLLLPPAVVLPRPAPTRTPSHHAQPPSRRPRSGARRRWSPRARRRRTACPAAPTLCPPTWRRRRPRRPSLWSRRRRVLGRGAS